MKYAKIGAAFLVSAFLAIAVSIFASKIGLLSESSSNILAGALGVGIFTLFGYFINNDD
jgi:hypothetical protein